MGFPFRAHKCEARKDFPDSLSGASTDPDSTHARIFSRAGNHFYRLAALLVKQGQKPLSTVEYHRLLPETANIP